LEAAGAHVLVLTNSDHRDFVTGFGLAVVGTAGSCREDHRRPEFVKGIETGDFKAFFAWQFGEKRRQMAEISEKECEAVECFAPDLIYATPLTYENACRMSDRLGTPMILGSLFPALNPLSMQGFRPFQPPKHITLVHWSESVAEVPRWLRRTHHAMGFLVVEEKQRESRAAGGLSDAFGSDAELRRLEAFVEAGAPPVYLGWGSMIVPRRVAAVAVRALRHAGLRGVLLGGWAKLDASALEGEPDQEELEKYAAENILFVGSAPHEWLFPRCTATVHHGGAGTVAAALRAGVPTVVTPCGLDQHDNARLVERCGCGVGLGHISGLAAEGLAAALVRCRDDEEMRARCSSMGARLRSEDGLGAAVAAIDRYLARKARESKAEVVMHTAESTGADALDSTKQDEPSWGWHAATAALLPIAAGFRIAALCIGERRPASDGVAMSVAPETAAATAA